MEHPNKQQNHSDLIHNSPYDAPEVVPGSQRGGHLQRNSTSNGPQVYIPPPGQKPQYDYYGGQPEIRPYYEKKAPVDGNDAEKEVINNNRRVKMCGLRPKVFFWILGIGITVLVIAAVLGGVLGSVLGKSKSKPGSPAGSSKPNNTAAALPSTQSNTGLAAIRPEGSDTLYQYYQDEQGRIIENQYFNGKWLIQGKDIPSTSIVGTDAQSGSPVAATSWLSNGVVFRNVFYIDGNGRIMSSNTTGSNDWPTPYSILPDDSAMPGTNALAMCSDTDSDALNGIRLYFASSDLGIIREVGMNFNDVPWTLWATFNGSDPHSGVASVLAGTVNHVYLVNASTGALQQWTWDYNINVITSWQQKARSSSYIAGKSDIAAVYDGISTDHIFYEGSDSTLMRALYYGQTISNFKDLDTMVQESKIAAIYDTSGSNNGATVFYQPESDPTEIKYETIDRSGQALQSGVVN